MIGPAQLGITDRRAHGIITDLVGSGYVIKTKDDRRNQYLSESTCRYPTRRPGRAIGEVVELLTWTDSTSTN